MTLIEELVKIILPDFLKYLDVLEEEKNVPEKEIKLKDGKSIIISPEKKNNIVCELTYYVMYWSGLFNRLASPHLHS